MNHPLYGLVAATHTPFHSDGSLASEVIPTQAAFLAGQGLKNVFITGSTGEGHSMTRDERVEVFEAWSQAGPSNGMRVVAHVGSNCLHDAMFLAAAAAELGFFATAAIAPSYNKPATLKTLVACCREVAAA